jgi:hypothetical protein
MSLFVFTKVTLQSGETVTVHYLTEEGKKLLEHLQAMEKYEENRFHNIVERLDKMQDELVRTFFLEKMQVHIAESLRNGPKTQQEVTKTLPDFTQNPMVHHAFYAAWKQWEKFGVILPTSHGRGHPRTWELSVLKKER